MKIKLALLAGLALLLSGCVSTSGYSGYSSGRYYNVTEYDDYSYDDAYYGPRPLFNEFSPQYFDSWSSYRRQACYWEGRYCDGYSYYHRSPSSHFDFYIASYPRYSNISECLWYSRDPWPCYRFAFLGYDPYYFDRRGYYYGYGRHSIFYHRPYGPQHNYWPRHPGVYTGVRPATPPPPGLRTKPSYPRMSRPLPPNLQSSPGTQPSNSSSSGSNNAYRPPTIRPRIVVSRQPPPEVQSVDERRDQRARVPRVLPPTVAAPTSSPPPRPVLRVSQPRVQPSPSPSTEREVQDQELQ
jgi:hypothetical protein